MIEFKPLMPIYLLVLYLSLSSAVLVLCMLSFVAIYRTKKTPYATKLLSLGLLTYSSLFLALSLVSKLFDFSDVYPIWHATRGYQVAAQIVVGCMALERLFVLNWPYVYLRVVNERRTKILCIAVVVFGFLQYAAVRGAVCYARNKAVNCGLGLAAYLIAVSVLVGAVSFICFIKIYKIITQNVTKNCKTHAVRQYKGTVASFLVLVNTTVSQAVWLGLSVWYFTRTANGLTASGLVATPADWSYLINCIVDPAIYVIWFRETRMELLKLLKGICPCVKPKIEKLRTEIYQLSFMDKRQKWLINVCPWFWCFFFFCLCWSFTALSTAKVMSSRSVTH